MRQGSFEVSWSVARRGSHRTCGTHPLVVVCASPTRQGGVLVSSAPTSTSTGSRGGVTLGDQVPFPLALRAHHHDSLLWQGRSAFAAVSAAIQRVGGSWPLAVGMGNEEGVDQNILQLFVLSLPGKITRRMQPPYNTLLSHGMRSGEARADCFQGWAKDIAALPSCLMCSERANAARRRRLLANMGTKALRKSGRPA
ncbi:hypothetical protein VTK26DRAFT_8338 [Humicola hyalothermophila]